MKIKPLPPRLTKSLAISLRLSAAVLLAQSAQAVNVYWDTNGATVGAATSGTANGTWDAATTGNWTTNVSGTTATSSYAVANGGSPATADIFFSAGTDAISSVNVTLNGAVVANSITVQDLLNITSATGTPGLTLGAGGVTIDSTAVGTTTWISTLPTILSASQAWNNNSGSLFTVNGTVTGGAALTPTLTFSGSGAGGTTLAGVVANGAGGTLAVNVNTTAGVTSLTNGANSFSGGLTLTQGILRATQSGATGSALGSGGVTLAGGELRVARATAAATSFTGANVLVTGSAQVTSDVGTGSVGTTHTLGTLSIGSQTLTIGSASGISSGTAGIIFGATTLTGNATFDVVPGASNATQLTLGAINGGTNSLIKTGAGTLIANTAASSFSGNTLIKSGTVSLGNATGLGSGTISLGDTSGSATATLRVNQSFANAMATTGNAGTATIAINTSGASGSTASGSLTLGRDLVLDSIAGSSQSLSFSGAVVGTGTGYTITHIGSGSAIANFSGTLGAGINGFVQNSSTSGLQLTGTNAGFVGSVLVSTGSVTVGANALNASNVVTVDLNAALTSSTLTAYTIGGLNDGPNGGGVVTRGGGGGSRALTLAGSGTYSFSGVIQDNGANIMPLIKTGSGRQTLSGSNSYTGATTVTLGTLIINGNQAAATGAVSVSGSATLGGNGTMGGATTTLTTAAITSILSPGDNGAGKLTISGTGNFAAGATFNMDLGAATTPGTTYDQFAIGGAIIGSTAAAGLQFDFSNIAGTAQTGVTYTILTFGSISGVSFTESDLAMINSAGFVLDTSFDSNGWRITANSLEVQFSAIPEPSAVVLLTGGLMAVTLLRRRRTC